MPISPRLRLLISCGIGLGAFLLAVAPLFLLARNGRSLARFWPGSNAHERLLSQCGFLVLFSAILALLIAKSVRVARQEVKRSVIIAVGLALVPVLLYLHHPPPIDRAAMKRTKILILEISRAIENWRDEHGAYPVAAGMAQLSETMGCPLPDRDGWDTPLQVSATERSYRIVSLGADLKADHPSSPRESTAYENDIVFENGNFRDGSSRASEGKPPD